MKRIFFMLTLLLSTIVTAQGFAVVDMEAVLAKHPNTPNDKKLLDSTLADYSKERDSLRAAIEAKESDLDKQVREAQNPMLAPAKADELKKACEAKWNEIDKDRQSAELTMQRRGKDLSELERRLIKRTSDEIVAHITAYAKEKGYEAVFYKNVVPYVMADHDITDRIIVLCGSIPDKKNTSKPAEELKEPAKF